MTAAAAVHPTTTPWFNQLFGEQLVAVTKGERLENRTIERSLFDEKYVIGIYFTELGSNDHFLKTLLQFYQNINANEKKLQVIQVFISPIRFPSGSENEIQDELFKNALLRVPWFALPIQPIKQVRLLCRYEARDGSLILLNGESGHELTRYARDRVLDDPDGAEFPWCLETPLSIRDFKQAITLAFKRGLLKGGSACADSHLTERTVPFSSLDGFTIGLYFSAHWCPPCKAFTRQLITTYIKLRDRGKNFEVVFVSSDRSISSFQTYLSMMPWLALPYEDRESSQELTKLFDIHGIPTLVILDKDLNLITLDGRGEINDDPDGKLYPWCPADVNILTERSAKRLQYSPSVILFLEGRNEIDDLNFAKSVLTPAAEMARTENGYFGVKIEFFVAFDNDVGEFIRDKIPLDDDVPLLALTDFPINRVSTMEYGAEITEESVKKFIKLFLDGKLPYTSLSKM